MRAGEGAGVGRARDGVSAPLQAPSSASAKWAWEGVGDALRAWLHSDKRETGQQPHALA